MKHKKIRGLPLTNKKKSHHKKEEHKDKKMRVKRKKYSPESENKIKKVMHEWGEGELHSGSKKGPMVKNKKQAVAIAISEARKRGMKVPKRKKK